MNFKQIGAIISVIILGSICGLLLVVGVQFYQTEIRKAKLDDLHVLTPKGLVVVGTDSFDRDSSGKVDIYYSDNAATELAAVKFLLGTKEFNKSFDLDKNGGDYEVYIITSVDNNKFLNNIPTKTKFTEYKGVIVSGNFIYLTKDFSVQIPDPTNAYQALWSGFATAQLFNELTDEELGEAVKADQGYDLNQIERVQAYIGLTNGDADKWVNPYPSKTEEYVSSAPICADLKSYVELMICELVIFQSAQATTLPPASQKFVTDNYKLDEKAALTATQTVTASDLPEIADGYDFKTSKVKFTAWDFPTFSSPTYQAKADNLYLQNADQTKLDKLQANLKKDGWELSEKSAVVKDDQFKVDTYKLTFTKDNPLQKAQLTIAVMDTKTMGVDCIIEGVGIVYCDQKASITKNTGLYLQLAIGQYSKYTLNN